MPETHVVLFDTWGGLIKVLLAAPLMYFGVVLLIRLSGKRSTSQMNNFDWIVTVAMGSLVASPLLIKDVAVAESLLAIGLLLALQWLVTKLSTRSDLVVRLVRARPTVLLHQGRMRPEAMRRERVSEGELLAAIRQHGLADASDAAEVILESNAGFSVLRDAIPKEPGGDRSDGRLERAEEPAPPR